MTAILHKALAGDLHQRYVSASAFESDLTLFLQNRPTVAEMERRDFVEEQSDRGKAAPAAFAGARGQHGGNGAAQRAKAEASARATAGIGDEHFGRAVLGTAGGPGGVRSARLLLSLLAREQSAARQPGLHARERRPRSTGIGICCSASRGRTRSWAGCRRPVVLQRTFAPALLQAGNEVIEALSQQLRSAHSGFRLAEGRSVLHALA